MGTIEGGTVGAKRFLIFRFRAGDPDGPRRELVDEMDLFGQAESLPALLAAEHATRAGTALRAPAAFSYEVLCARTGAVVARHDVGEFPPAWALEVLGAAGALGPAAA